MNPDRPLALLGAFPFPYPQGSQVFMADQATALQSRGVPITLFTYGRGQGPAPAQFDCAPTPRWASPRAMRSGPQLGKPLADLALLGAYARRAGRYRAALAHNAEAALIALAARRFTGTPVVYVVHTLLAHELSAYGPSSLRRGFDRVGGHVDRFVARRADALIALCDEAADALAPFARGPVEVIPPGHAPEPPPAPEAVRAICEGHGLQPDAFALYSGNFDGYQELDLLIAAAKAMPSGPPIVVASHDERSVAALAAAPSAVGLRGVAVRDFHEMRSLIAGARMCVLTRRRPGGFPIKLLNYMEAGRAIVAFERVAVGLRDGESAALLADHADPSALADTLLRLHRDDALRQRLGAGARRQLEVAHPWPAIADRVIGLVERVA